MHNLRKLLGPLLILGLYSTSSVQADERDDDRKALRMILQDVQDGINQRDLDKIMQNLADSAVITYQNADVSRGKEEVKAYFGKFLGGSTPFITAYQIKGDVSAPAEFFGDVAVAHGTCTDHMELSNGSVFDLDGKWSSTIVKKDGRWQIALLHFSSNVLDNSVINGWKKGVWYAAAASFVAGLLAMLLLARFLKKT